MISAHLLRHVLVIERAITGVDNDHGMPTQTWTDVAQVRGRVQPKTVEEVAQLSQGGPVASTHTVFLLPTDVREADRIRYEPSDGRVYQIDGIDDAAGQAHHYELHVHRVSAGTAA